jgi:hypothetical protein
MIVRTEGPASGQQDALTLDVVRMVETPRRRDARRPEG